MVLTESTESVASLRIAVGLRRAILQGEYSPGERIRQEVIAEQFGASRLPVREALRILQSDGLITLVANSGAWVSQLDERECAESYEIRERLEPLLLRESMSELTPADLKRLRELAGQMERETSVETFLRLDREFHLLSYSRARTGLLSSIIERLWNTTQHYRRTFALLVGSQGRRVIHFEHFLLVDAIERQDAHEAQRVLESHIRRTRHELERHPEVFRPAAAKQPAPIRD